MAFRIVDRTYSAGTGRKPETFGYVEGYTSNTIGNRFLRLNCKEETDEERLDWYKRVYGCAPTDVAEMIMHEDGKYCHMMRSRRPGDIVGTGVRLDKKQVLQLIWELFKWLVRG